MTSEALGEHYISSHNIK